MATKKHGINTAELVKTGITTIYVCPVPRQSPQGRGEYKMVSPTGELIPLKQNFAKNATKRYQFPASATRRKVKTGLDEMIMNPWYGSEPSEVEDVGPIWLKQLESLVKREKISKQTLFEILDNVPPNTYTDEKKLSENIKQRDKDIQPNYLETFSIVLYDRPNCFSDDTSRGRLAIQLCKMNKRIANSYADINPSRHDFYIAEENEDAQRRITKRDLIQNAIADLVTLRRKQTPFLNYQVGIVLKTVKGVVAEVTVRDEMNKYIEESNKYFNMSQMERIEKFNQIIQLIDRGREGLEILYVMYLIQQALNENVMSMRNGHYFWHAKKGIDNLYDLGTKYEKVLKFFADEFAKYDESIEEGMGENWYRDLANELRTKGIRLAD